MTDEWSDDDSALVVVKIGMVSITCPRCRAIRDQGAYAVADVYADGSVECLMRRKITCCQKEIDAILLFPTRNEAEGYVEYLLAYENEYVEHTIDEEALVELPFYLDCSSQIH